MIDVLLTPSDLLAATAILPQSQVVILDVLRATSTIVTALHNGARSVTLFPSLDAARQAKNSALSTKDSALVKLAGESNCLRPPDFDLGNSPREFLTEKIGGASILLATTNGTLAASRAAGTRGIGGAKKILIASLLNASASAEALLTELDATPHTLLICAGTNSGAGGKLALEDTLGAGAILFALLQSTYRADLPFTDNAWLAYHAFAAVRERLPAALRLGQGALNIIHAGLEDDIDHCAQLNAMPLLITLDPQTLICTKSHP